MSLTLDQIRETTQQGQMIVAELRQSTLTDDDLLDFLYDRKELRCLGANDAHFGDRPRYTLSDTYMQGYRDRLEDMAKRNIPTGTKSVKPMVTWGEGYQTVAEHF
ncbi:MAG: hypothetical protein F6J95_023440 [Leptolyngbya sp. SIO1E4]|nr:hypothetical protein [Leptolyngbya sp. SIO1E4]